MKFVLSIATVMILSVFASGQNPREASVRKALADYDTAWNKKDSAGVSHVLADDYVYFSSTGSLTDRKKTLEVSGIAGLQTYLCRTERDSSPFG